MNASQLYSGEYYAYRRDPPKGQVPLDAIKVRLQHTEQRKSSYEKNRRTFASVVNVETGKEMLVSGRELIMFWDEYVDERDHLIAEREEAERKRKRQSLRRTVIESHINYRILEKGIPLTVQVNYSEQSATVSVPDLMSWLGISNIEIERALDNTMEEMYPA